jgi:MOSC domain-containing protein YiiM
VIDLRELSARFAGSGRIEAIVLRPQRLAAAVFVPEVQVEPGRGLAGDHRSQRLRNDEAGTRREITLIQHEHLPLIAAWSGHAQVDARRLRRNLVVSGVNLAAAQSPFADRVLVWRIGAHVLIAIAGPCAPCSRMEAELGAGGYNALRGHGGVTARVMCGGPIRVASVAFGVGRGPAN